MEDQNRSARLAELLEAFVTCVPHHLAIDFEIVSAEDGVAVARMPYREDLVGNPDTGFLHGGVVTTLLDSTGGIAVFSAMSEPKLIATLDLRIDYLKPAPTGAPVYARVRCYKLTRTMGFTRGVAYYLNPEDPVASMSATYIL